VDRCRRSGTLTSGTGDMFFRHPQENRPTLPPTAEIRSISATPSRIKFTPRPTPSAFHPTTPLYIKIATLLC
jgi:hypothetical protein